MITCEYIYCRTSFADTHSTCPRCGFPRDKSQLQDTAFLKEVKGLPTTIIDMHQILPAVDNVLEFQLKVMEQFGIEKALLQSVPPPVTSIWGNDKLRGLAQTHSERFWISQFVDPRMPDITNILHQIADMGIKVIKLIPPTGYSPDEPQYDDFWATLQERNLVAMLHTGFITARHKKEEARAGVFLHSRYANPLFLDLPARKFPNLTFILCHIGGSLWYEEAAEMVTLHDNVWGDISGSGIFALQRLLNVGATFDWTKVFWGNDSPPWAYPFNLRLLLAALSQASAEDKLPLLLYDNAQRFSKKFLS
ncbi:MAG: hypothetical protein DRR19_30635 [Candidatus Parabeggiatoa sp. nov. 1]|nr:MAG: hypothetical protein DRR19_30635 [Gammaproteobacteria bacterium]